MIAKTSVKRWRRLKSHSSLFEQGLMDKTGVALAQVIGKRDRNSLPMFELGYRGHRRASEVRYFVLPYYEFQIKLLSTKMHENLDLLL